MQHRTGTRIAILAQRIFDGDAIRGPGAVLIEGERIAGLAKPGDIDPQVERIELDADLLLAPGLVDCQVNGGAGLLLNDDPSEDAVRKLAAAHQAFGSTTVLPTLITDAPAAMETLARIDPRAIPGVPGFHLEGPFINVEKRGVHSAAHVRELAPADIDLVGAIAQRGVCLLTLAPERAPPGAIRALREAGAIVSLGHSNASAACARDAADEGATGVTHLFNAMSQMSAREPGLVGATFADERLFAGVIADGLHVAPLNLALAHRILGARRLMLVSDAMPSIGALVRSFRLMDRDVSLEDGPLGARLALADGTLAGAHLTMAEAVKRMVSLAGAALSDALRMATGTPARFLGLDAEIGGVKPGAFADLVALDGACDVRRVWLRGRALEARRTGEPEERAA